LDIAKYNTSLYWKKNKEKQKAETLFELIEENHKNPTKTIKTYKNPIYSATENNLVKREIKKATTEFRDQIKKKLINFIIII
jgi:ribonuclease P protein component